MPSQPPAPFDLLDAEKQLAHPQLDYEYIDQCACDIAARLSLSEVVEAAYQPGDSTFYGLVFTPVEVIRTARARRTDAVGIWDAHAIRGLPYGRGVVLVARVEGQCYPFRLCSWGEGHAVACPPAFPYVDEKLGLKSPVSAVSVALLLRRIGEHVAVPGHVFGSIEESNLDVMDRRTHERLHRGEDPHA